MFPFPLLLNKRNWCKNCVFSKCLRGMVLTLLRGRGRRRRGAPRARRAVAAAGPARGSPGPAAPRRSAWWAGRAETGDQRAPAWWCTACAAGGVYWPRARRPAAAPGPRTPARSAARQSPGCTRAHNTHIQTCNAAYRGHIQIQIHVRCHTHTRTGSPGPRLALRQGSARTHSSTAGADPGGHGSLFSPHL